MTTTFWILALAMCVAAAGFILAPLYLGGRRGTAGANRTRANVDIYEERLAELRANLEAGEIDEDEFRTLEAELKRNLLSDTAEETAAEPQPGRRIGAVPIVMAVLVPLFALFAYSSVGLSWGAIGDVALARQISHTNPHDKEAMYDDVARLEKQLQREPDNDQGWFLLAQSYMDLELYDRAAKSFTHLIHRYPQDYNLASYYMQAVYLENHRKVTPQVNEAIQQTLKLNPHDISALEILGMDAYAKNDLARSLGYFRKALVGDPDKQRKEMLQQTIAGVEKEMRKRGLAVPAASQASASVAQASGKTTAAAHRSLSVRVEVGGDVKAPRDASVFVFARALHGPPMPLAVKRMRRSDLPAVVQLDDTMGMVQGMSLANFNEVQVVARISTSGIANASPDDYEARSAPIDLTKPQKVITLKIEHMRKDLD